LIVRKEVAVSHGKKALVVQNAGDHITPNSNTSSDGIAMRVEFLREEQKRCIGGPFYIAFGTSLMTGSRVGQSGKSDKEQLVGSWMLLSLTAGEGANQARPYGPNPKGTMMVDANGRFSITVLRSDLPKFVSNNRITATPDENKAIVQGSIA
jgi:hypothetical protein